MDLLKSPGLVGYVLEYFVHKYTVERAILEWEAIVRVDTETNVRMCLLGSCNSVGCDIYAVCGSSPRI